MEFIAEFWNTLEFRTLQHSQDVGFWTGNDSIKSKLDYKDKSIRNQRKQTEAKRLEERNKAAARKKAEKTKAWSIQKDKVSRIFSVLLLQYLSVSFQKLKLNYLFQKLKKELKRKRKEEAANRKITTEEMEDINEDYKNLKKRLKGKITEKQLDNKLGLE